MATLRTDRAAQIIRLPAFKLFIVTRQAALIRPTVIRRFTTTQPGTVIWLMVTVRFLATRPAASTLHWAITQVTISPQALTISISATRVWLASQKPFALAQPQCTGKPLSPALAGQRLQEE